MRRDLEHEGAFRGREIGRKNREKMWKLGWAGEKQAMFLAGKRTGGAMG